VFFLNMVVFALMLMVVGKIYDRYGPKWVIVGSTFFISAGFVLTSFMRSIEHFFFTYGVLAAIGVAGTAVPLMATLMSKWFDKLRGLAISLSLSGHSMGHFVLIPLFSLLVVRYGWRASYLTIGAVMFVVNVILTLLVIKGDPHQLNLLPLGRKEETEDGGKGAGAAQSPDRNDFTLKQAMRTPSYWFFTVMMFICGSGDYFVTTHLIPFATDQGVSPITAGSMLGWYGFMSLVGILIAGPAADRIGNKIPIVLTFALRVCLFLLVLKYKTALSLYVFALLFGFTHLITAPLTPMLIGKLYGPKHLGLLTGFPNTIHFVGGGLWPYLAGVIFDRTGSYQLAFSISAVAAAVAVGCALFIVDKRHRVSGAAAGAAAA
jgi:MFS family permease